MYFKVLYQQYVKAINYKDILTIPHIGIYMRKIASFDFMIVTEENKKLSLLL